MSYAEKRGRRATGLWYGETRHPKAGRFRKRFKTKALADAYEAHIKAHGVEPDWARADAEYAKDSFKRVADDLKALGGPDGVWARGRDPSTLQRLAWVCDQIGTVPVNLVTRAMIEDKILRVLLAKPGKQPGSKMANSTINKYLSALSAVMTYAEQKELIERCPKLPWRREAKHHQPTYTDDMLDAMGAALRSLGLDISAFVLEMLDLTAFRYNELYTLQPQQITGEFIRLNDPDKVKNDLCRTVWIGLENANKLRVLLNEHALPDRHTFYHHLQKALKACEYTMTRLVYALRHTAASRAANSGQPIEQVADFLGHRDTKTTKGYVHLEDDVIKERAKKIAHARGEKAKTTTPGVLLSLKKSG